MNSSDQRETFIPQEIGKSRIVDHNQPSQNIMTNQVNPSCWEALRNLRNLNVSAPFVDCLFDLHGRLLAQEVNAEIQRKRVAEKDKDIELKHTITIDGVTYYSAKHYRPADGDAVIGFEKGDDFTYRSDLNFARRPYPFVVWYHQRLLSWSTFNNTRKVTCKVNIIAWTDLPHPKSAEEFQDFCNNL